MLKRPRKDEDEEDLLRLQQDFLSQKQKAAAQATKCVPADKKDEESIADNHDIPENIEINVVERDTSNSIVRAPSRATANKSAFPKTFKLKREASVAENVSLFAQSFGMKAEVASTSDSKDRDFAPSEFSSGSSLGGDEQFGMERSYFDNLLERMTPEEINEERNKILKKLEGKQDLVEFIKSRRLKKPQESKMDISESLPITKDQIKRHKWLNMNKIEKDKLEWLKPIPNIKRKDAGNEDILQELGIKDARFDLHGNIITDDKQESLTGKEGLHHHGEEPERGGYTLSELLILLESSFASQKVIALNLLGRIMEQSNRGVFDHLLEMSSLAEQLLVCTPVLLVVRKLLDDTSSSVSTSALACLKQIICNLELDELYLDRLFSWCFFSSTCYPKYLDPEFKADPESPIHEMPDDQYVRKDPIPALIRTDLLVRIAYMIENQVKCADDPIAVKNLFSILIRIARHSEKSCERIIATPHLLPLIIKYFLQSSFSSVDTFYGNPYSKAVKLVRILCQTKANCIKVYNLFGDEIVTSCLAYIALDPLSIENDSGGKKKSSHFMQLIQETLKLLIVLTDHHFALEALQTVSPLLVPLTQYLFTLDIVSMTSPEKQFDWQFASSLILILTNLCRNQSELTPIYFDMIQRVTFQWIQQIFSMNVLPSSVDASNALMAGVNFLCVTSAFRESNLKHFAREESIAQVCNVVGKIFSSLATNSCIINVPVEKSEIFPRSCSIHPEYRSLLESSNRLHPSLADDNVLPLVQSIISSVNTIKDDQVIRRLLLSEPIQQFILKITRSTKCIDSSFSLYEVKVVQQLLLLSSRVLTDVIDGETCRIYLLAAIRLVPMVRCPDDKKILLEKVIFNDKLYCNQLPRILEASLTLNQPGEKLSVTQILENAHLIYSTLSPLCSEYWIFDPILYVTKVVQSVSSDETDFQESIEAVLAFIQLLCDSAAGYFDFTGSRDNKFSAVALVLLMSVYLTGSKYFLNDKIKRYMKTALQVYLVDERPVDRQFLLSASSPIPAQLMYGKGPMRSSLHMTQYFERLLQEYAAESYSDALFTSFMFLFLRSHDHTAADQNLRLVFFSEANTELLQSMYTRIEEYDEDLLMQMIQPPEKDIRVIELFTKCLLSRTITLARNPVLYWMLVLHVHHMLFKNTDTNIDEKKKTALSNSIAALKDEVLKSHLVTFRTDCFFMIHNK